MGDFASMFADVFDYKQWADCRTLDAVKTIDATRHPSPLAFACQQLNHMVIVEELFKARLLGEPAPHASTNTEQVPGLPELELRITTLHAWFTGYLPGLEATQLQETLTFQFADGKHGSMTRQEILFHIVNHGTYHRGAIGHALDLAGAPRPADTYTVYVHAAEPQRRDAA